MIPLFKVRMEASVGKVLQKTLYSGFIGQGEKVQEFEKALIPWVGSKNLLTVNSCTSALTLALRLSGVGSGDEVISTPVTCTATNTPILNSGAKLIWADVNPWTGLIDPESVKAKITKRTKAVVAVRYAGLACDLSALSAICRARGLKLILDAAQAIGMRHKGILGVGPDPDFTCFSFQAVKPLTCGDGGLLVCKSREDAERARLLRWYGIRRPPDLTKDIPEWGYKFHMNDLNATIGLENLKGLKADLAARKANAEAYHARLTPFGVPWTESTHFLHLLHIENRPAFVKHMRRHGIQAGTVHERNDLYTMFKASRCRLPGVDAFCATQVAIPVGPWVSLKDRIHIAGYVLNFTHLNNG